MRNLLLLFLVSISLNASGTGFSFGTGGYWRDICTGVHDELNQDGAIATCTMFLLGYQSGALEQARESRVKPLLCHSLDPNALPADFVVFVNSNIKYEKMNVLGVMLAFTKGNKCGV